MQKNTKYTIEEMTAFFREKGCELLETEYHGKNHTMKYRCKCGRETITRWSSFKKSGGCKSCSKKSSFDEVKQTYIELGCELLETTYVNAHASMKYRCKCGNIYQKPHCEFKKFPLCNLCGKTSKNTVEEVKQILTDHGCELIGEYHNNDKPLTWKCKCGEIVTTSLKRFLKSKQCRKCSGRNFYTFEQVNKIFEDAGCKLLDTNFVGTQTKMKYECKCGQIAEIKFDKFRRGARCKNCGIRRGENHGNWNPDRELVELNAAIASRSLAQLKYLLKKLGQTKADHMCNYLGYTVKDLVERIKTHPNWENVKDGKWHIDHIFPISAFLKHGIFDPKIINDLDNLRPLSQFDNLSKNAKYDEIEFEEWLNKKGIKIGKQLIHNI